MNTQFTSDHRLILSTLGLCVVAVMVAYFFSGMMSLLVAGTLCILLWLFRPLLMPPGYGATKIRTLSVLGILGLASSYGLSSQIIGLAKCASKIQQYGLTNTEIPRGATDIVWFIFDSPAYRLEAPVRVIDEDGASRITVVVIDVLSYARIARVTQNEPKSFAFVHRRFLECLVTTRLLDRPEMGRGCLKIGGNGYWEHA